MFSWLSTSTGAYTQQSVSTVTDLQDQTLPSSGKYSQINMHVNLPVHVHVYLLPLMGHWSEVD